MNICGPQVIVTRVIAYRTEIKQRDIRWKTFIQEEIIFTDALYGQQGAVQ